MTANRRLLEGEPELTVSQQKDQTQLLTHRRQIVLVCVASFISMVLSFAAGLVLGLVVEVHLAKKLLKWFTLSIVAPVILYLDYGVFKSLAHLQELDDAMRIAQEGRAVAKGDPVKRLEEIKRAVQFEDGLTVVAMGRQAARNGGGRCDLAGESIS